MTTYTRDVPKGAGGFTKFFEDYGVWKEAPILTGSTKFEPLPDVKNVSRAYCYEKSIC
jgi:hypothetical protein